MNRPMSAQFVLSCMGGLSVLMRLSLWCHTRHTRHVCPRVINVGSDYRGFWRRAADGGLGEAFGACAIPAISGKQAVALKGASQKPRQRRAQSRPFGCAQGRLCGGAFLQDRAVRPTEVVCLCSWYG